MARKRGGSMPGGAGGAHDTVKCRHGADNHHEHRKTRSENPQPAVQVDPPARDQRGLNHEEQDPAGEDGAVQVDERCHRRNRVRRIEPLRQVESGCETDEDGQGNEHGHAAEEPALGAPAAPEAGA